MRASTGDFDTKEALAAQNFKFIMEKTTVEQVIYLSGIINEENLSRHLQSRKQVEEILYRELLNSLYCGLP